VLLVDPELEVDVSELRQSPKNLEDDVDSAGGFSRRLLYIARRRVITSASEHFHVVGVARDDEGEKGGEVVG